MIPTEGSKYWLCANTDTGHEYKMDQNMKRGPVDYDWDKSITRIALLCIKCYWMEFIDNCWRCDRVLDWSTPFTSDMYYPDLKLFGHPYECKKFERNESTICFKCHESLDLYAPNTRTIGDTSWHTSCAGVFPNEIYSIKWKSNRIFR